MRNVRVKTYTADAGNYIQTLHLLSLGTPCSWSPDITVAVSAAWSAWGGGCSDHDHGPRVGPQRSAFGRPGHNTVSIKNAAYVTVRDLELDGRGAFVDAVKAEGKRGLRTPHHA